jgi:hypothetical protein
MDIKCNQPGKHQYVVAYLLPGHQSLKLLPVLGAGLLAMPSALSKMGIFLGIFVIAWAGMTSAFGLYLQTRCARYVDRGHVSFAALSQLTYPNLSIIFDAAIAVKCFGVAVSYLIIIGDLMPGVVRGFAPGAGDIAFLHDRQFWITAFMYEQTSPKLALDPLTFPGSSLFPCLS